MALETQSLLPPRVQDLQSGPTRYGTSTKPSDIRIKINSAARARIRRGQKTQINNTREYKELTTDVKVAVAIFILLTCPISVPLILISRYCARKETSKDTKAPAEVSVVPIGTRAGLAQSMDAVVVDERVQQLTNDTNESNEDTATVNPPTRGPAKSCLKKTRTAKRRVNFSMKIAVQLGPQLSSDPRNALKKTKETEADVIEDQAFKNQRDEDEDHTLDTDGATEVEAEVYFGGRVSGNDVNKVTDVPTGEDEPDTPGDLPLSEKD